MTERFTLEEFGLNFIVNDNGRNLTAKQTVDRLNKLNDENEQLRKENDILSCELSVSANKEISRNCRIAELERENEQLKSELAEIKRQDQEVIEYLQAYHQGNVENIKR